VREEAIDAKPFPKGALIAAALLVGSSLVFAAVARMTDIGATRLEVAPAAEELDVTFTDLPGGSVGVVESATNRQIAELKPGQSGFVRVVMRGLAHDRKIRGIGPEAPFRIARHTDGQSTLTDLATGEVVTLTAFGGSNAQAFEQFLAMGRK
jgi:putative photosynthetic complex assembly protein